MNATPTTPATGPAPRRRRSARSFTTRVLLTCAAFAAVQVLVLIGIAPFTATLAAAVPPGYALVAGLHSLLPFAARHYLGITGTATLTAMIAGFLASPFSPIGMLLIVPLAVGGAAYDLTLAVLDRRKGAVAAPLARDVVAGAVAGVALFAVSLPVFSAEHLTWPVLAATLAARMAGEIGASVLAARMVGRLRRAGVRSSPSR